MDLLPCGPQWARQRGAAAAQRNRLKAYAKEHGFEVVGTSSDIAIRLKFDHRPGLLEFHNEAVDGDVDILLVCDLDVSVHTADCGTVDLSFDATLYEIIEEIRKRTKRG